uniref:Orfan n=1 Tax=Strongyloides papillosus TaxID=174720 RepID=A0A0N5BP38_STREA
MSKTVRNKKTPKYDNVTLSGNLLCDYCDGNPVAIALYNNGEILDLYNKDCNRSFYINRYLSLSSPRNFTGDFYYMCNGTRLEQLNKPATYVGDFSYVDYYGFGPIILRKNYKTIN